jgi:transcriptional regulator with XRE-family HTH domain
MAKKIRRPIRQVVGEARHALGMSQHDFGYAVGASHRTAVRWDAGQANPAEHNLQKMAELLYPHNPVLAAEVADFADDTLESLGLEAPPPAAAAVPSGMSAAGGPQAMFVPRPEDLVDVVVLAAMEATGSSSAEMRALLHVVFKRAREVGLTMESAEKALRVAESTEGVPGSAATDAGASKRVDARGRWPSR